MVLEVYWKIFTFVAVLVLCTTIVFSAPLAYAQETTYLGVYPSHITDVKSGDTFTVKINIGSTIPFVGYQFCLYWNKTYINATDLTDTPPAVWSPFFAGTGLEWNYNATHGRIERGALGVPLVDVPGNFTVATITFTALMDLSHPTVVPLHLDPVDTFLADANGNKITPYYVYDYDVHVIDDVVSPPPDSPNPPSGPTNTTSTPPKPTQPICDCYTPSWPWGLTYFTVEPRPLIYLGGETLGGETKSPIDALTWMSAIPIWAVLLIVTILVVVTITLSISLAYLYGMREHEKGIAKY